MHDVMKASSIIFFKVTTKASGAWYYESQ